jgi:hypothetical protein
LEEVDKFGELLFDLIVVGFAHSRYYIYKVVNQVEVTTRLNNLPSVFEILNCFNKGNIIGLNLIKMSINFLISGLKLKWDKSLI